MELGWSGSLRGKMNGIMILATFWRRGNPPERGGGERGIYFFLPFKSKHSCMSYGNSPLALGSTTVQSRSSKKKRSFAPLQLFLPFWGCPKWLTDSLLGEISNFLLSSRAL